MKTQFREDMMNSVIEVENQNADNSVNWDFVDADMFDTWSVILDGETYITWFEELADEVDACDRIPFDLRADPSKPAYIIQTQ